MLPFSSRGPREDGGFTPIITAPGAAINTTPTWLPGAPGRRRPATPCRPATRCCRAPRWPPRRPPARAALLLSAAKQQHIELSPRPQLRTALTSTAKHIPGYQAHEQGAGLIDIVGAWNAAREASATAARVHRQGPGRHRLIDFR